jgi:hypothetical protein
LRNEISFYTNGYTKQLEQEPSTGGNHKKSMRDSRIINHIGGRWGRGNETEKEN